MLSTRLPARRIAKHILCGQNVRQVTFIEPVQPRPEIFYCPRERGVPHGGLWGDHGGCTNDLGDGNMGVGTADDASPQQNTKSTMKRLENAQNHPAHHISTSLINAVETTSKIPLSSQH